MEKETNLTEVDNNAQDSNIDLEGKVVGHHSHHGSHSHHSSRSHHSSHHHKKRDETNKFKRFKKWLDKQLSRKGVRIVTYVLLFAIIVSISVSYWVEKNHGFGRSDTLDDYSNGGSVDSVSVLLPSYWDDMIKTKTNKVKALQVLGGKDCVSFVWASDPHIPDNTTGKTADLGKLMSTMLDNCNIPFALLTGDIGTRASYETKEEFAQLQSMIPAHLAPLWGTERLLVALGNHDGCYGDATGYYKKQYSPEELWQFYFANQALDSRRVFSDDGTYFYVDNVAQKTRFIILNSQYGGEYSVDANGWATNDRFASSCYGQEQLNWLANVALDMPKGYGAVIASHVPPKILGSNQTTPYTVDSAQLCGIIDAYNNKTVFSGTHTSNNVPWSNSVVNVDFTKAKGEIMAMFTGHVHEDTIDTKTLSCPLISVIASGAAVNQGEVPERPFGTDKETSLDVVTINRKTRTINLTRVGWGADRVVSY